MGCFRLQKLLEPNILKQKSQIVGDRSLIDELMGGECLNIDESIYQAITSPFCNESHDEISPTLIPFLKEKYFLNIQQVPINVSRKDKVMDFLNRKKNKPVEQIRYPKLQEAALHRVRLANG